MIKLYRRFLFRFFPTRLLRTYRSRAAHRMYFLREYELAYRQIWRAEFFREQKKELREEIRREYDKAAETLNAMQVRLDEENKNPEGKQEIKDSFLKQIDAKAKDIEQFKQQIDHIDTEVGGYSEAIESLHATMPSLEEYIKR